MDLARSLDTEANEMRRTSPSKTARKVALNILTLGAKRGMEEVLPPGIVETTAEMLVASGTVGATVVRLFRSATMVPVYQAFDWLLPGQFEAFGHRKALCEKQVRDGIASGAKQVLVLGAGYDTLGYRLAPEFPHVAFFEIDHPDTSSLKSKAIEQLGRRSNLHLLPEDLSKRSLSTVVCANQVWDRSAASVVVAEGLLMYLPPPAPSDLFKQCAEVTGDGSRVVFTYVARGTNGRPDVGRWTGLVLWLLKVGGEPWLWSIRPEDLAPFLTDTGWRSAPDLVGSHDKRGVEYYGVAVR
jgi:methyltransferase (TIGR00027 family)